MKKTFIDYLSNKHAEQYSGLDDEMPDAFNEWLESLDIDDCIDYANEFLKEQREDILKEVIDTIDAEIGCIKDGNALSSTDQDLAINVAENIKTRLKNN